MTGDCTSSTEMSSDHSVAAGSTTKVVSSRTTLSGERAVTARIRLMGSALASAAVSTTAGCMRIPAGDAESPTPVDESLDTHDPTSKRPARASGGRAGIFMGTPTVNPGGPYAQMVCGPWRRPQLAGWNLRR